MYKIFLLSSMLTMTLPLSTLLADLQIEAPKGTVKRDHLVKIKAVGYADKAALLWRYDKKSIDAVRSGTRGDTLLFVAPPGTYTIDLTAITLDKDGGTSVEEASVDVVIEDATSPKPPLPSDPLTQSLQGLYSLDAAADKADVLKSLTSLYRSAPVTADDVKLKTIGDLFSVLKVAATTMKIPPDTLLPMRARIQQELMSTIGRDPVATLDPSTRASAKAAFARIAAALEGVR